MQEKEEEEEGRACVCVCVGYSIFDFVLERAVRACVCVDGEGSFGSGRAFPALAWWWCVMSLRCVSRFV